MAIERLVCLVLSVLFACTVSATENGKWVSLWKGAPEGGVGLTSMREAGRLRLTLRTSGLRTRKMSLRGVNYDHVYMLGCGNHVAPGEPSLPIKLIPVEIPKNATCMVEVLSRKTKSLPNMLLPPQQSAPLDGRNIVFPEPEFRRDAAVYSSADLFPKTNVVKTRKVTIRNRSYLEIYVTPVQFNPAKKELLVSSELVLEVSVTKTDAVPERLPGRINLKEGAFSLVDERADEPTESAPQKYMILYDNQFVGHAKLTEFIEWKKQKGYDVVEVKTSDIPATESGSPTHTEIWNYLRGLAAADYPLYLLILGDERQDLGVQGYRYTTMFGGYTDLYLACRDANDYYPDLFCGRLPAKTPERLTLMLSKVMEMDRTPPTSADMYDKVMVAGQVQDSDNRDNRADRLFCETADAIACYFEQDAGGVDYNCVRAIVNPSGMTATGTWNQTRGGVLWTNEQIGSRIFDTFVSNDEARARVTNSINRGVALIQHRDHGDDTGWGDPPWGSADVDALSNGANRPAVFSINCLTGRYNSGDDNFARRWLLHPSGGAYAVIAATDVSYSWHNDWMTHGFYVAHFDDYISFHNNSTAPDWTNDLPSSRYFTPGTGKRLGEVLNFGKMYYAEHYTANETTFRLFHCFGDPESFLQIHQPTTPNVTHDAATPIGAQFSVQCADGSMVCIYSEDLGVHQTKIATGGTAQFDHNAAVPGDLTVTVTKYGARPYEGTVAVISPDAPWIGRSLTVIKASCELGENPAATSFVVKNLGIGQIDYTITSDVAWLTCTPTTGTSAGEEHTIGVTGDASGLAEGVHEATITIADPNSANGAETIAYTVDVQARRLVVDAALNFGDIWTGMNHTAQLTLTNPGKLDTTITDVTIDTPFSHDAATPVVLPANSSVTLTLSITPVAVQTYTGELILASDAEEGDCTVQLTGEAAQGAELLVSPGEYVLTAPNSLVVTDTMTLGSVGDRDADWSVQTTVESRSLESVLANLNLNSTDVTSLVPNRYSFSGGESGVCIYDGGADMYDTGNILNTNLGVELPYSNGVINASETIGARGRYFTRKYSGLFVLAADLDGVSHFEITGNLGADGVGDVNAAVLECTRNRRQFKGFVKRVYNAGDPSVNHLVIVENRGELTHTFSENTNNDQHRVTGLAGTTRLYYLLFASRRGGYVDDATCLQIMETFLDSVNVIPNWLSVAPSAGVTAPGETVKPVVTFDASRLEAGTHKGTIFVSSNDPRQADPVQIPVTMTVEPSSRLSATPTTLVFPDARAYSSSTTNLRLTNTGNSPATLNAIEIDNGVFFLPQRPPVTVPAFSSIEFPVYLVPTVIGTHAGTITIRSDAEDNPVITIPASGECLTSIPVAVTTASDTISTINALVTLSGSGSYDRDNAPVTPLTYAWTFVSGPEEPALTNVTGDWMEATFTPVLEGSYVFRLEVSDGEETDAEDVTVVVGDLHVIGAVAGPNGQVRIGLNGTPSTEVSEGIVHHGTTSLFYAIPDDDYIFVGWYDRSTDNPRQILDVTSDYTMRAEFAPSSHNIVASAGAGGAISPSGTITVPYGEARTFLARADSGYVIEEMVIDGTSVGAVGLHTFNSVTANHTIEVTFSKVASASSGSSGGGGGCSAGALGTGMPLMALLIVLLALRTRRRALRG